MTKKAVYPLANNGGASPLFRGRIWIDGPEGTFIGYGRVILLERILELGSLAKAAKSIQMSYRHAWYLVDSMNRQAPQPFVKLTTGGKNGGGAVITAAGKRAVKIFRLFNMDFQTFLQKEEKKFAGKIISLIPDE